MRRLLPLIALGIACQTPEPLCERAGDWRTAAQIERAAGEDGAVTVTIADGCAGPLTIEEARLVGLGFSADLPAAGERIATDPWTIDVTFTPPTAITPADTYAGILYIDAEGLAPDPHGKTILVDFEGVALDTGEADDTGADTGADTGGFDDTGRPECGVEQLAWTAEVRLPDGSPCTSCPADLELKLYAVVYNPCPAAVTLTTDTTCLHCLYGVGTPGEPPILAGEAACKDGPLEWTLPPAVPTGELIATHAFAAGEYTLIVQMDPATGREATTLFTTEPMKAGPPKDIE